MPQGIFDVQQGIFDVHWGIVDVRQGIFNVQQGIFNVQQGIVDVQQGIVDVQQGIIDVQQGIVDVQQGIVDVQQGIIDVQQGIFEVNRGLPVSSTGCRAQLGNLAARSDDNGDAGAGMAEHLDQAVDAEAVDLSAHEITDSRLRHTEELGSRHLGQVLSVNQLRQLDHQVSPDLEVLRLLLAEPEIPEHVSCGASSLDCHLLVLSSAPESFNLFQTFTR